jgi:hypothetical protein
LIPSPIRKVLSSMQKNGVQSLLMGGQACVIYGGAEFSRDTDLGLLSDLDNLSKFQQAIAELQAERIAVPPFGKSFLDAGLAVHFRCRHPEASGLRIDVMAKMRGLDRFEVLWQRRTTRVLDSELTVDLLSLPDLVQSKKTQRDKDWPMLRRLVEADYFSTPLGEATEAKVRFWLRELRTPGLLIQVAQEHWRVAENLLEVRPLIQAAIAGEIPALERGLQQEMEREIMLDREYWAPLRRQLEELRRSIRS